MAELVTGHAGKAHATAEQAAGLNAGILGLDDYVLNVHDKLKITVVSANKVTIGTGELVMQGRHVSQGTPEDLIVTNGSQGQKRNDLIVCRYTKGSQSVESAELVVVRGTPTTGTATDPEVTANDLKLWRVPLDGINAGKPVALFETMPTMAELGGSHKSVIKSARVGNSGMLTLECAEDGSWISLRGTAFWSKHSDAWASMVQIPGYASGSDWYIDTGLTVPKAPGKAKRFDGVGWQCTADAVQPMYINNLCIVVAASGKVYLGEWSKNQGATQFIAVPNGGRMSMGIGY